MSKRAKGYSVEENLWRAFHEQTDRDFVKPVEDVVGAAMLAYLESPAGKRAEIRQRYIRWLEDGAPPIHLERSPGHSTTEHKPPPSAQFASPHNNRVP